MLNRAEGLVGLVLGSLTRMVLIAETIENVAVLSVVLQVLVEIHNTRLLLARLPLQVQPLRTIHYFCGLTREFRRLQKAASL